MEDNNIGVSGSLDYNQLVFLQINRIENTTAQQFNNTMEKLTSLRWQIEGLRNLITKDLETKTFSKDVSSITTSISSLFSVNMKESVRTQTYFNLLMRYFSLCIGCFASKGKLYKKMESGDLSDV